MSTILTLKELEEFINNIKLNEIKDLLLKEEGLEKEKNSLNNFLEVGDEDTYFFEESLLAEKFINLENELDKFTVSAKGRDWKRIIKNNNCININGENLFTPEIIMSKRYYYDESRRRNDPPINDEKLYKIHFYLLRFRNEKESTLTFYLGKVF